MAVVAGLGPAAAKPTRACSHLLAVGAPESPSLSRRGFLHRCSGWRRGQWSAPGTQRRMHTVFFLARNKTEAPGGSSRWRLPQASTRPLCCRAGELGLGCGDSADGGWLFGAPPKLPLTSRACALVVAGGLPACRLRPALACGQIRAGPCTQAQVEPVVRCTASHCAPCLGCVPTQPTDMFVSNPSKHSDPLAAPPSSRRLG